MPFPKLSSLLRQKPEALSLRERAADLQDRLARSTRPALGAAATAAKLSPTLMRREDLAADAELLRLGREFEAAAAREIEACAAINAAAAEAKRHEPAFPACLTLTAADHELNVYQHWTHPEALDGITLSGADVDWLKRKMPMGSLTLGCPSSRTRAYRPGRFMPGDYQSHPHRALIMSKIVPFPGHQKLPAAQPIPREEFERLAELALNIVDRIVFILDGEDGDPDLGDGGDAEPSLGAPENHHGSHVVWLRGGDRDLEAE